MTYEQALDLIHSQGRLSKKAGVHRMKKLMELLGNPHKRLEFVHVAGTNGKGSTTAMIAAACAAAGKKTGKFISPFVIEFRERFQINDEYISKQVLVDIVKEVMPLVRAVEEELDDRVNEFELTTTIGLVWFARECCDVVVLEAGIGGRTDATNVIDAPKAAVISTIGLDHTALLGETIGEITLEKCGIIKNGCVVVSNPSQPPEAVQVIKEQCTQKGCKLVLANEADVSLVQSQLGKTRFVYGEREWELSLSGSYQVFNAVAAIEVCKVLGLEDEAVQTGLRKAFIPARLEVLSQMPLVLLDGAHNPAGAKALSKALKQLGSPKFTAVTGMLREKDWQETEEYMLEFINDAITLTPNNPRALSGMELAEWFSQKGICAVYAENCEQALKKALQSDRVLIFGSLYLAAELREEFLKQTK
ncbi:MAG: bifunctional folylpolyglutamate synthase/dihydrofolate synthase [Oscillospiraceae bacterium]|nr:bifunctional folylpolyglutamate synthase/dihydrofolate synthase [Oscillospiraceae bacterium]